MRLLRFLVLLLLAPLATAEPTLWIIGDSTVRNQTQGQMGWGDPLVAEFDPAKIRVINRAIGGRSSRTFLTEGRWDAILAHLRPGDFVLIQFGHNDSGPLNAGRARASLKGIGPETETITRSSDGREETVLTYGAYLRRYILDARKAGATALVVSPVPRNRWRDDHTLDLPGNSYPQWAGQVAKETGSPFIDLHRLAARGYEALGREAVAPHFDGADHTHTSPLGAEANARRVAAALRRTPLADFLLPADLWLPRVFSEGMVLQHGRPNPIWGRSLPSAELRFEIAGKTVHAVASSDGSFSASLPALPPGENLTLRISGPAERTIRHVAVGEVWLCSGQSNMDFTLAPSERRPFAGVENWREVVRQANDPAIRHFSVSWRMAEHPQREVTGSWQTCTPETAGDFSAVAYAFAAEYRRRHRIPVGLITSAYGASTAEAWIRPRALETRPEFQPLLRNFSKKFYAFRDDPEPFRKYGVDLQQWLRAGKKGRSPRNPDPVQDQHHPSVLSHAMIRPVAPYGIRGVLWYQGESNLDTRHLYTSLQNALIGDWRDLWQQPELPFYFVQLAPYRDPKDEPADSSLARMRAAQAASLALPHTGMVVTLDVGDARDIHPRRKLPVGQRLARLALNRLHENSAPGDLSPEFASATLEDRRIRLRFRLFGSRLITRDRAAPRHLAISADGRHWVWAQATLENDEILVSHPEIPQPRFVRYAWADNPDTANLINTEGLPLGPFECSPQ